MSSKLRRHRRPTLAVLLVALALVLAQLAGPAHELLVPHRVCAEHGELVEGAAALLTHGPAQPPQGPALSNDEGLAAEHEHCPLALLAKQRPAPSSPSMRVAADAQPAPACVLAAPRVPAIALHRLAPKQSPPA